MPDTKVKALHFRGFGDLAIYLHSRNHFSFFPYVTFDDYVSSHLVELYALLPATNNETRSLKRLPYIDNVPPLFSVRNSSLKSIAKSFLITHKSFFEVSRSDSTSKIFMHEYKIRERLANDNREVLTLPASANIYEAYLSFFSSFGNLRGLRSEQNKVVSQATIDVGVFPSSRVQEKTFSPEFCRRLEQILIRSSIDFRFVYLKGDITHDHSQGRSIFINKNFRELITAVKACRYVVSADSLPAHLAEYFGIDSLVFSHSPNQYWLPLSSFRRNLCGGFHDSEEMIEQLITRLQTPSAVKIQGNDGLNSAILL